MLRFPVYDQPAVSIVIPAHNKFWVTYNCLAALLLAPNQNKFEIIVVDDGSTDLTIRLGEFVKGITVLRNESSQGFVRSSNLGARNARGETPPILLTHGDQDPVLPVEAMFIAANELAAANIPCQWHLSFGIGHGIDGGALRHGGEFLARAFAAKK